MISSAISTSLIACFATTDTAGQPEYDMDVAFMQYACMQNALFYGDNVTAHFDTDINDYFLGAQTVVEDCCTWRWVKCTDFEVTTLIFRSIETAPRMWRIQTEWLPNTLQYLILKNIVFEPKCVAKNLPRDLRYLYIRNSQVTQRSPVGTLILGDLPANIEEAHMHFTNEFCGTISVVSLPKRLELCTLVGPSIKVVLVDNGCLPKSLKQLRMNNFRVKVRSLDGGEVDSRVVANKAPMKNYVASKYSMGMDIDIQWKALHEAVSKE